MATAAVPQGHGRLEVIPNGHRESPDAEAEWDGCILYIKRQILIVDAESGNHGYEIDDL